MEFALHPATGSSVVKVVWTRPPPRHMMKFAIICTWQLPTRPLSRIPEVLNGQRRDGIRPAWPSLRLHELRMAG